MQEIDTFDNRVVNKVVYANKRRKYERRPLPPVGALERRMLEKIAHKSQKSMRYVLEILLRKEFVRHGLRLEE